MAGGRAHFRDDAQSAPARACAARSLRLTACNDNRRPDASLRRRLAWIFALLIASAAAASVLLLLRS
jgi:hypothetical protein